MKRSISPVLVLGVLLGSLSTSARAATIILHNFTGMVTDGSSPLGSVTLSGSTLYGMTNQGGSSNSGAIFKMNTDGTGFGLIHSLAGGMNDGQHPYGSLTLSGSKLYGMTYSGGPSEGGVIFSVNTDGTGYSLLHGFLGGVSDGLHPRGALTLSGSKLYGLTFEGGRSGNGTLFSINTDGTGFSLLHDFNGNDGKWGAGSLTLSGSKLYGMTARGGLLGGNGFGTVFSMNTDGTGFTLLHSFVNGLNDGAGPTGSLTLSGSKLYGVTHDGGISGGGSGGLGTLFSMNTDGTGFGLLHTFMGGTGDGAYPGGALTLSGSTLYGMTLAGGIGGNGPPDSGNGTLFRIGIDGTGFSLLETFAGYPTDGGSPWFGDLTLSADGSKFYAMTAAGGNLNQGVVFSRAVPGAIPEPGACALLGLGAFLLSARRRNARA